MRFIVIVWAFLVPRETQTTTLGILKPPVAGTSFFYNIFCRYDMAIHINCEMLMRDVTPYYRYTEIIDLRAI